MSRRTNDKIRKQHLILCEGADAENFLINYLESAALAEYHFFANDIQVMDFGGNENLQQYLAVLQNMDGFDEVKTLLIIRDAERDAEKAVRQIKNALQKNCLPNPEGPGVWNGEQLRVGFLLFPACGSAVMPGTLEDLCLSILSEADNESILNEIDDFLDVLKAKRKRKFPHEFKTRLHTYFAITDDYVSLKIGEAARAGAFNWKNDKLLPLKEFVKEAFL